MKGLNMRTKRMKLSNGKAVDAVLLCGGYGVKVYGVDGLYIVAKGKFKREYSIDSENGSSIAQYVAFPFTNDDRALVWFRQLLVSEGFLTAE